MVGLMPVYRVFEQQVIVYAWDVEADHPEEAEATAYEGVPDYATTMRFSSETDVELAPPGTVPDRVLAEEPLERPDA